MEYFISALWIFLEIQYIFLFLSAFIKRKKTGKAYHVILCATWAILYTITNLEFLGDISPLLTSSIVFALTTFLFYGKWYTRLFLQITIVLFSSIIDTAATYGASILLNVSLSEFVWMKLHYFIAGTSGKLLLLFLVWILYRFRTTRNVNTVQGKWFLLTVLFPAISLVMLALSYYNNQGNTTVSFSVLLISMVIAVANIGIIYLIHALEKATIREQEAALLKQQIRYQKENFSALESSYRSQRKATHEFERHLQTLSVLLAKGEQDTASQYVAQLQKDKALRTFSIVSHHPVVDVILNQKYQLAREYNISMQITINDLSAITFQTDDLVVLLGNLLDNAIEACRKTDGRKEILCDILSKESLYISVRNTSMPVEIVDDEIASGNSDDIEHGYGIPAIKYILNQLNAEYIFQYINGWFQFAADIPIK